MDTTTLVLFVVALLLLGVAAWRGRDLPLAGLTAAWQTLWRNLPLLLVSFAIAGLAQVLIPREWIVSLLGEGSGLKGVLIACVVGGLTPGAPYAAFPIVASFYQAGASLGAVVGFVSAWSLWSVTRLPVEMALIDPKAAAVRYAVTFIVPPLAGLAAMVVGRFL